MPTDKRRIAAYLSDELDEALQKYKMQNQISGDSQAIIAILTEYFGATHSVAYLSEPSPQALVLTEEQRSELKSELLSELKEEFRIELLSELKSGSLKNELLAELNDSFRHQLLSKLKSELLNDLKSELLVGELGKNLFVHLLDENKSLLMDFVSTAIAPVRDRLETHSQILQQQFKVTESSSQELELPELSGVSIKASLDLPPISNAQLAKRFKVSSTTLSNKRRGSEEKFCSYTQEQDPDNVCWSWLQEDKSYIPINLTNEQHDRLVSWYVDQGLLENPASPTQS